MEEAIKSQLGSSQPAEISELNLETCKATSITGLNGEEFCNLATLSFINVGLTSLDGLPRLEKLISIDLSENKLTGEGGQFDVLAEKCPHLCRVNLCGNDIKEISALASLAKLTELEYLDIFECPITTEGEGEYRAKVFEMIPQLKYLDNFDINDEEADDDLSGDDMDEEQLDDEEEEDGLSDEEGVDYESGDDVGLNYLDSSKALQDEDESEDYHQNNDENVAGEAPVVSSTEARASKRKHADGEDSNEAIETKKANGAGANGTQSANGASA